MKGSTTVVQLGWLICELFLTFVLAHVHIYILKLLILFFLHKIFRLMEASSVISMFPNTGTNVVLCDIGLYV